MDNYDFLYQQYQNSVCAFFTSSNFDIVSTQYDFANAPEHNACSSDARLVTVKSHRKTQVYYCSESNFSACSFYNPTATFVKSFSLYTEDSDVFNYKIDVFKMKIKKEDGYIKDVYILCSIEKQQIYIDFDSTGLDVTDMLICELFVKEAADKLKYRTDPSLADKVESVDSKKNSYFSRLTSFLTTV